MTYPLHRLLPATIAVLASAHAFGMVIRPCGEGDALPPPAAILATDATLQSPDSTPDARLSPSWPALPVSLAPKMCANDPVNGIDPLGLLSEEESLSTLRGLKDEIAKAAREFGVPPRYIAATMYAELRFNVSLSDQIQQSALLKRTVMYKGGGSIGPAQMKPVVAVRIEQFLHDPRSPYYLGKKFEALLPQTNPKNVKWDDINREDKDKLWERLTGPAEVRYVAAQLRMFASYWIAVRQKQIQLGVGVDAPITIADRVDILATLYNLGFDKVAPKADPQSNEFGKHALDFYQSSRLLDSLPKGLAP